MGSRPADRPAPGGPAEDRPRRLGTWGASRSVVARTWTRSGAPGCVGIPLNPPHRRIVELTALLGIWVAGRGRQDHSRPFNIGASSIPLPLQEPSQV